MLKKTLVFVGAVILLSACTVKEELTFNKDFSGSATVSYNLSMYGEEEENDSTLTAQLVMAEAIKDSALKIKGISDVNFRYDEEESAMIFTYSFASLKSVNDLYKLQAFDEAPFMRKEFNRKGKKQLTITWPVHELTQEDREAYDNEMMDMYTHELTINLPKAAKSSSISTDKITHLTEGQKATFSGGWGAFYTHTEPVIWKVKM